MLPIDTKQTVTQQEKKNTFSPLYKRKVRSSFKAWLFTPLASFFLDRMIDPLVDMKTGLWIIFWIGIFSIGVTSHFFAGFYGAELRKEQRAAGLNNALSGDWLD